MGKLTAGKTRPRRLFACQDLQHNVYVVARGPSCESATGNLPAGVHWVTGWGELAERFGTNPHRKRLLGGLQAALRALAKAGCKAAYIGGSFVTNKVFPKDFDGCWEIAGVDPHKLDPVLLKFDNQRAAQKAKFGGELFPASGRADGAGRTYLEFLQFDRTGAAKGIIAIDLTKVRP